MHTIPPVSTALMNIGIPHEIFVHQEPPKTLEQAAIERGQRPEQIIRSILFRISEDDYVMVLMAGPGQIQWKALRKKLGVSRITMASREEIKEVTGYKIGAVAPFGLHQPFRVLVDQSVAKESIISMGSGIVGTAIILESRDLLRALGHPETGSFGVNKPN